MEKRTLTTAAATPADQSKIRAALRTNLLYRHYLEPLLSQPAPAR